MALNIQNFDLPLQAMLINQTFVEIIIKRLH